MYPDIRWIFGRRFEKGIHLSRSLSENALSTKLFKIVKNNARNITYKAVLIFQQFFDFEQVSADSEISILGQAPDMVNTVKKKQQPLATFFQRFSDEKKLLFIHILQFMVRDGASCNDG